MRYVTWCERESTSWPVEACPARRRRQRHMLIPAFKLELNNAILRGLVRAAALVRLHRNFRAPLGASPLLPCPTGAGADRLSASPASQAAVGSFDGEHPSLTCATSAGKIFFHSPHEKEKEAQVRAQRLEGALSTFVGAALPPPYAPPAHARPRRLNLGALP